MTIPFWKKALSYLTELHVESAPSEVNPHLYVSLKNGRYQLSTENAVYSYEDLYDNFTKTFAKIDFQKAGIEEVLVLGLGLGSIPLMLEKVFKQHFYYTAIELDENVVYLAEKYALQYLKSNIQTICTDAYAFVAQTSAQYDLIAMDVFLDDTVPSIFLEEAFLLALKQRLTTKGLLCFNRLALTEKDIQATRYYYENVFKSIFPQATYLEVSGNWMLLNHSNFLNLPK